MYLASSLEEVDDGRARDLHSGRCVLLRRRAKPMAVGVVLALFLAGLLGFAASKKVAAAQMAQHLRTGSSELVAVKEQDEGTAEKNSHAGSDSRRKRRPRKASKLDGFKKDGKTWEPDQGMGFPTGSHWPSLFCYSVMNAENAQEIALIKGQLRNRSGIFGCDNVAVLSGKRMLLGDGHKYSNGSHVQVYTWVNPAHSVPMGNLAAGDNTNSFKNTDIFINAWNILVKSKAVFGHNWTAKVDPDAVFFAYRLRWHVKKWTHPLDNAAYYLKNCLFKGPQLYGALEVFNEAAMRLYDTKGKSCTQLPWGGWGEDEWIDKCMQMIGAHAMNDYQLVGDHRCMAAECGDTWRVAFHDYKTEEAYYNCWKTTMHAQKIKDEGDFCCTYSANHDDPCGTCLPSNKQWPGKKFCGGSRWACHQCGATTAWCRSTGKTTAVRA